MQISDTNFDPESFLNTMSDFGYNSFESSNVPETGFSWTNQYNAIETLINDSEEKEILHMFPELNVKDMCYGSKIACYPIMFGFGSSSDWFVLEYNVYELSSNNTLSGEIGTCYVEGTINGINYIAFNSSSGGPQPE